MIILKRESGNSIAFKKLAGDLDRDLSLKNGNMDAFFSQYNKLDTIRNVIIAYDNDQPIGCGAIKHFDGQTVEVKRMYVLPDRRGNGSASKILSELERWAKELGYVKCVLETGKAMTEAIGLYKKHQYRSIPNFGQYALIESSVCFEKEI